MSIFNSDIEVYGEFGSRKFPFQENVLAAQVDNTLDPGASPAEGDRYIINDAGNLNANFGVIAGLEDDDIVEYRDGAFIVFWDASVNGEGALSWNEADNKWCEYNGSGWATQAAVVSTDATIDGDGSSGSPLSLADDAVSTAKILNDAVTTAKILDANVTADKLAADSVVTAKILDANVTADKLAADSVVTAKILDANVTEAKLAPDAVTTAKVANDAIDDDKLDFASTSLRSLKATWSNADGVSKVINHAWNTTDLQVEIYDDDTKETLFVDSIDRTDANNITLTAIVAPPVNYIVLIRENQSKA